MSNDEAKCSVSSHEDMENLVDAEGGCMFKPTALALAIAFAFVLPANVHAQDKPDLDQIRDQIKEIKESYEKRIEEFKQGYDKRIEALERRLEEAQSTATRAEQTAVAAKAVVPVSQPMGAQAGAGTFQLGLDILGIAGMSSVKNAELAKLQAGGHDPSRNGFTIQNVELTMSGAADPYFDAQANIVGLINAQGQSQFELEEAYLTTRALPWGLQVKAGQSFLEFGRQNQQHPHSWDFVDQPIIMSRLFGADGLRDQGARVSWLTPVPWYSELYFGVYNASGATVTSFLFDESSQVGGYQLVPRDGARHTSDFLYLGRWLNGFDLGTDTSLNAGISVLRGPNSTGTGAFTNIYGGDLYLKWRPPLNQRGFPFVGWQTEVMYRDYEAIDAAGIGLPNTTLKDWGYYTQVLWGFSPGLVAALRFDQANGNDPNGNAATDPFRDRRWRISPNLTWFPTEFSKLRLQYNHDDAAHLPDGKADSLWLQFEVGIGSHAAHKF